MGRRTHHSTTKSHTLPSSPTHSFSSSSSSDFEFTISISPRKSSAALCPADELFYKGQLLPLHHTSRLSMVRTLLSSSSTSSSSDTTTTASRDSTASHSSTDSSSSSASAADLLHHLDCDSSRPSSVTDDEFKRLTNASDNDILSLNYHPRKSAKYFSLAKFSSVFRKENKNATPPAAYSGGGGAAVKRVSSSAKEVIRKYLKKVKPLYEKLSQKQQQQQQQKMSRPPPPSSRSANTTLCVMKDKDQEFMTTGVNHHPKENTNTSISHSFSGNLRYPRRRSCISSCPSSMMSSPSHGKSGFAQMGRAGAAGVYNSDASSMEELQSAIQGAIAHCKNSMLKNKNIISNEI
ncbi:putative membrane-associated kinase regulator 1 [Sesamum alatum]|uniref:Membrane-associated kinase regulator 1 n=1 Tax=Sesamum alatum TaxID=300844 RepID=A0AAE1Y8K3_9LAMI|nr:putative membrane-associated kinase regulator 1 [Sesamum alatum]